MTSNLSAGGLFLAGMAVLPAFLFQESLAVRVFQVVLFGWLTTMAGKRLLWLYFITISLGITVFHVLIPTGAVLFEIGGFPVTTGALRSGIYKSLTIVGMVFISLISVRADLKIPGRVGAVAGKLFWSFEQIMERRDELRLTSPLHSADELLLGVYRSLRSMDGSVAHVQARKATAPGSTVPGRVVLLFFVAVQWAVLFIPFP
jgi:hypothetical protein